MQPPVKRRKLEKSHVEEISFDTGARQEYLTGFHKRKLQRAKNAQEAAARKARLERIEERRKLREQRKADLERHVQEVNALLQPLQDIKSDEESQTESDSNETDSWDGISEIPTIDHEAEYVDEDRYTTVTIEAMDVSKEGFHKAEQDQQNEAGVEDNKEEERAPGLGKDVGEKRKWSRDKPKEKLDRPKPKKKKFRYESKGERKIARVKQKMRNSKQASARRAA